MNFHSLNNRENGLVAYMQRCEVIYGQVGDPITDLVVPSNDKAKFLQSIEWVIENFTPHPLQQEGSSGVSNLQQRNNVYLNSCAPSSIQFMVYGLWMDGYPDDGFTPLHHLE